MSVRRGLFIGPYAEWRVRIGKKKPPPIDQAPWYEALIGGYLLFHAGGEGEREIKVGRVRYAQHFFLPADRRPNEPPREMHLGWDGFDVVNVDWSWLNPRAEIDWFSEAYQAELRILADHFGEPPALRWGPLSWET